MKTLIIFAVLVTLSIATWLFIPLLQGRDADFETRLALLQGRGGDFGDTPSEATPTPPSQAPGAAPSRPLSGPAKSVEAGGATGKAAETSIGEEPGDRPSIIENGQTRELGQKPLPPTPPVDHENATTASATDAVRTQQDATFAFLVRQRLRTLGLDPGQLTLDSELGPQARAAIKKYQREHGLPVDGQVSVALLDHIDRVLSGGGRIGDEGAAPKVAEAPPAPPPPAPKTPAKEAGTAPAYKVQLAAVRSLERAQGEWERMRRKNSDLLGNLSLSVVKADLGPEKGVVYRLRAGPVTDKAAARALCAKLARQKMGCLVVRPGA